MRIVSFSFSLVKEFTDPEEWLKHIRFSSCVLENMVLYGEVIGIYHLPHPAALNRNKVSYHFTGYKRWQLLLPFQFITYIKKLKPDVVLVHGLNSPWQIVLLRMQLGNKVKIVVQHHAERPLQGIRQYFQRWADYSIDAYLFCSKDLASQWVKLRQIKNQRKVKEVMEVSSLFYSIERNVAREKTKMADQKNFLWIGRLLPIKNPLIAVLTFARFAELNPGVKLYMIYQSNELLEEVAALIEKMKPQKSIVLVGKVEHEELIYWYNSVDYIISSSQYEGSGTAVCEAMSCGCIPILSSIPSFRMMTDNGRIGMLYEEGDEHALLSVLQKSLELNRDEEKKNVLNQFETKLSPQAIAREIYEVIVSLK